MGTYISFWYNDHDSSEYNIYRVTSSNRYDETIALNTKDTTADNPGRHGSFFIDSSIQKKDFTVNIAYDNLDRDQIDNMREWLDGLEIHKFRFDNWEEEMYIDVKVTGTPQLKFIPFDGENGKIIYKGEGTIQFTSYSLWRYKDIKLIYNNKNNLKVGGEKEAFFFFKLLIPQFPVSIFDPYTIVVDNVEINLPIASDNPPKLIINNFAFKSPFITSGYDRNWYFCWDSKTGIVSLIKTQDNKDARILINPKNIIGNTLAKLNPNFIFTKWYQGKEIKYQQLYY